MLDKIRRHLQFGRDCARFGDGPLASALLFVVAVAMPIKARVPGLRDVAVPLRISFAGRRLRLYLATAGDLSVFNEVFVDDGYGEPRLAAPATILDLGANIGLATLSFAARYPDAHIYCLEPDPRAFAALQRNIADLPHVTAHQMAAAGADGPITFNLAPLTFGSAIASGDGGDQGVTVEGRTLDGLLDTFGIARLALLKLDIEGAEDQVLRAATSLERIDAIVGEIHVGLMGTTVEGTVALLDGFKVDVDHHGSAATFERYTFVARAHHADAA